VRRVAIVTGGTKGIGRAIAARLAAEGAEVIAAARHLAELPAGVRFVACDVSDADSVKSLFAGLDRVDALVNAAGMAGPNPLVPDDPLWAAIIAANLNGPWYCCTAALGKLPDRTGRIVNISSVLGLRGVADQPAYCAAKHGLIGLTRSLALALAPRGITVNAVCPGWVDTDMAQDRFRDLGISGSQAAAGVPLRRIATPDDIADSVAFLLSPAAAHITGHALPVDGGGLASA
jgi:NAD(P)-dependent dehydrogenase (short-subunit alcohol dehydrogenase family)